MELLNYFSNSEAIQEHLQTPAKVRFILLLINFIMFHNNKDELLPLYVEIVKMYTNPFIIDKDTEGNLTMMQRTLNNMLSKMNDPTIPLNIFSNLSQCYPENEFSSCKAYAVYNAYQLKSYAQIQEIMDNFYICLNSREYADYVDFITMNYYKGLIFLAQLVNSSLILRNIIRPLYVLLSP
jgi:hypothetical protein